MIKNILVFKRANINYDSLNCWAELAAEQFQTHGITVHFLSLSDEKADLINKLMNLITNVKLDAALAFNAIGQQNWMANEGNLWDVLGIPFFNYIVDHPLEHFDDISCECNNYHLICVDKNHADFVAKYYPMVKSAHFLPLGGLGNREKKHEDRSSFMKRKYDIALTAGLWRQPDDLKNNLLLLPDNIRNIAILWIDYMETHLNVAPEIALQIVLKEKWGGDAISDEVFLKIANAASRAVVYIRAQIRKKIVENIARSGICLHIWGEGWDDLLSRHKQNHFIAHESVNIRETVEIYRNAKLALNILPMFKNGAHDRIATAQLNGAAVFTDSNGYLKELYDDSDSIFFYDLNDDDLSSQIEMILSNSEKLYETALQGQRIARENLTWEVTGSKLIEIIREQVERSKM